MRRARFAILLLGFAALPGGLFGEPYTIVTYNVGLLRVLGWDLVPAVETRTRAAPAVLSGFLRSSGAQIVLLEEVWQAAAAQAIAGELAGLGYTAVRPDVRGFFGLTSGLLLLVKSPLRVVQWKFTPFDRTTFVDSFARKGVIEAVLEDLGTGARFAVVGAHTVAVDTDHGQPRDPVQLRAILAQADQVRAAVVERSSQGSLPVLLLGDFNAGAGYVDAAYRRIAGLEGLREAAEAAAPGDPLVTWDPANPLVAHGGYPGEPPARIDHIFLLDGGGLHWTSAAARVEMKEPVAGLSFLPRGSAAPIPAPLSDHYALVADVDLSN